MFSNQKHLSHPFCRRPNAEDLAEPVQPLGGAVTVEYGKRVADFHATSTRPKPKYQRNQVCSIRKLLHEFNEHPVSKILHVWHADPQFLEVAECDCMSACNMSLFNVDSTIFWVSVPHFRLLNIEVFLPGRPQRYSKAMLHTTMG